MAVLVASKADPHAGRPLLDVLALVWLALRGVYKVVYLGDRPTGHSVTWSMVLLVCVAIFTMRLWHG